MYNMGHTFDHYDPNQLLFVSEYAARGENAANGTLDVVLAEAVFMNGMEVNSHVIRMASYAPLFASATRSNRSPTPSTSPRQRCIELPPIGIRSYMETRSRVSREPP